MAIQQLNAEMVDLLRAYFQDRNEPNFAMRAAVSPFFAFPGLRGLWRAGNRNGVANLVDLSGQSRTLTDNNTVVTGVTGNILTRDNFDGTNQFYSRADEAGLSITGLETHMGPTRRGLCFGWWCYPDTRPGAVVGLMTKWITATNNRSYMLTINAGNMFAVSISNLGTANDANATWATAIPAVPDRWWFVCADYDPSNYLRLYVGDSLGNFGYVADTTGIPASIFDGTAPLELGRYNANNANCFDGKYSVAWLASGLVGESLIRMAWEQTRSFYPPA